MTLSGEPTVLTGQQMLSAPRFSAMSVVGFILAFPIPVAGIVVSIIALARSRKTGDRKGLAVAGVIVSAVGLLFTIVCLAILIPMAMQLIGMCAELGPGTHQIEGATYTCGAFGSSVVYR
ncbi:MAG: DUF4190 domain-containing protein [Microbacterium sp.]|uniref:DUF4190 domain-containing protein n=1 Tax=Microbacterium sp. TaxID=51671 RepID=UPI001AD3C580|nr:DUF4190 domain-containing protein [Microbacterium sp.]MBN9176423.1 DUF4190 domain-containing protein [Microbacterium sp.]